MRQLVLMLLVVVVLQSTHGEHLIQMCNYGHLLQYRSLICDEKTVFRWGSREITGKLSSGESDMGSDRWLHRRRRRRSLSLRSAFKDGIGKNILENCCLKGCYPRDVAFLCDLDY